MMPAGCGRNASTTPANANAALAEPSKANLATMLAQRWQRGQLDAGDDASMMRVRTPAQHWKNAIASLARPLKAKLLWADAGYSNKATGNDNERDNNTSPATCCDCIMTGQMPVHDAGSNVGVTRAMMSARQGQRRPRDKGNNAGATLAKTTVHCWRWRQHVSRLLRDWADASLRCWQRQEGNKGNNASTTRAKAPAQQQGWRQRNAGNNNSAMLAMTPAQCGQGSQHNAGKDANAELAGPSKAKSPWNDAGYSNEATGKDNDHSNNATHTDVLQLRRG
jgi:hypothetical protein